MRDDDETGPRPASRLPEMVPPVVESVVESVPGLARAAALTARAAWHTTEWGVRTSAKGWLRLGQALVVAGELVNEQVEHLGDDDVAGAADATEPTPATLRQKGQELLERSRDVWGDDTGHPAYERIISELAPDEARILVLLVRQGPQPSVDVRTGGPVGIVSSTLIAPGLNMIGPRAGVRHVDQVPAYLNNLFRLGLVWFSRESLRDPMEYQVVEAQPDVLAAMHSVRFAKVVRRSIHLTPFGEDFCRTVLLPEEDVDAELPEHATPPSTESGDSGS